MGFIKSAGFAFATLLLAAVLLPALADEVTWKKCKSTDVLSSRARQARSIKTHSWDLKATSLYLTHCNILHLHNFSGLPKVKTIVLANNNLQFVNPEVFKKVSGITELDLSFNRLSTVPVFGQHGIFESMTKLSLSNNRITLVLNLETFSSMKVLQELNLDNNVIRHIDGEVFKPLVNLKTINLASNKLSYIPEGMFQIQTLETIYLNDNAIGYVSPTAFGSSIKTLDLSANRLAYLPKDFVSKLTTGESKLINFELASNPWQCACLLELLHDVKKLGVCDEYYKYVFDGEKPLCVAHEQTECSRPSDDEVLLSVELANDYITRTKPYPVCA
ncbi:carboxypeptidase N subunit 2-like [Leguminivora glycinivorella]|uniref:carboxypeptidase N subunit 2-like n=1 Tax=Leguminivora glycinivorella TaxID=1035111 RepID=UPI00200D27B6|nr:carboxypeptidase N subunit 2-like [Leguminivora glycinivorella]